MDIPMRSAFSAITSSACISSAATLPLHWMPLIVVTMLTDERISIGEAGFAVSAYLLAICIVSLYLPWRKIHSISRKTMTYGMPLLLPIVFWQDYTALSIGATWFSMGLYAGVLQHISMMQAFSIDHEKSVVFSTRLALTMLLNGGLALMIALFGGFETYTQMTVFLVMTMVAMTVAGLWKYQQEAINIEQEIDLTKSMSPEAKASLWLVFFAMAFTYGFSAFSFSRPGAELSFSLMELTIVLSSVRVVTAIFSLWNSVHAKKFISSALLMPGLMTSVGVLYIFTSVSYGALWLLWCGLLIREIGYHFLSSRLQVHAIKPDPALITSWLTFATFSGSAVGPLIYGYFINQQLGWMFVLATILFMLVPYWMYEYQKENE